MLPRKPLVLTLDTSGGMLSSWTELGSLRLPRTPRTDDVPATIDQKLYWNEVRIVSSCCVSGSDADSQPDGGVDSSDLFGLKKKNRGRWVRVQAVGGRVWDGETIRGT